MHPKIALLPLTLATLTGGCAGSAESEGVATEELAKTQDPDETAEATAVTTTTVVRPTVTAKVDGDSKDGAY